jgi:DNA-binding NarL/FixJ family response regulator
MITEVPQVDSMTCDECEVIRVVIVDDREAMREGLRLMLSGDESIRVVGVARDGQQALAKVEKLSPDIVLLDITTSAMGVIEITRSIKEAQPHVSIIILNDSRRHLASAIKAGAVGFLARTIGRDELIAAIRLVYLWRLVLFNANRGQCALVKL